MTSPQRKFKILLIGDSAVGKTALLQKFTYGTFAMHAITLHFDVEIKDMEIGNRQVRLAIWVSRHGFLIVEGKRLTFRHVKDTGGQEKFRALSPSFFHGAKAAVLGMCASRVIVLLLMTSGSYSYQFMTSRDQKA